MSKNKSNLVPLLVTFAVLFIIVFALGIIIGKGLGGEDTPVVERTYEIGVPAEEPDLDVAEEEVVEEAEVVEIEEPASKVTAEDVAKQKEDTPKETDTKKDITIKSEDKKEETAIIESRKEEPAPTPVPKVEEPKAASTEDVIKDIKEGQLTEAPAEKEVAKANAPSMPKTDPGGRYTVQLAAFQDKKQADSLKNSLTAKGYPAFIKQYETPDKKTWYRVRVGTFSTKDLAAEYGEKLKAQQPEVKSVFITTNL